MENESFVHVIGMSGPPTQACQWIQPLRELVSPSPGRPPQVRLIVVHDDGDFLAKMSDLISEEAEEPDWHSTSMASLPSSSHSTSVTCMAMVSLRYTKSGEARAISCTLQLHRLLAADDDVTYNFQAGHLNQMVSIAQLQHMAASSSCTRRGTRDVPCKDDDDPYDENKL
ncbi:hypothetical protein ABZP36_034410 [Zizania latifolia]